MNRIYKYIMLTAVLLGPLTGCDNDELVELNVNPTQANELDWRFLLTTGMVQSAENRYINGRVNLNLASGLIQQMATHQVGGERGAGDKYYYHLDSFNGFHWYVSRDSHKTLAEVIRRTGPEGTDPDMVNTNGVAQVLFAYNMQIMTDLYGNVAYTEYQKGLDGIFYPKYDTQESIYKDMMAKVQAAANAIGTGSDDLTSADVIFGGDLTKWKRFANSLLLRMAMRISNVDPATAQQYAESAISGGVMQSNDDLAFLEQADGPSVWFNQNGISRAMNPSDWGALNMLSKTLVDWLQANNDPRLEVWAVRGTWDGPWITDPAQQIGMPNGMDIEMLEAYTGQPFDRENQFSRINPELLDNADPWIFQTYAEVELLRAEVALKGWNNAGGGTAEEHYNKGVAASMLQWGIFNPTKVVTQAEVDAYLAAHPFDGSMEMLHTQYWAANFLGQWYEAYSNWRRTGYPVLTPVNYPGNYSGGQIFRRIEYDINEVATNAESVQSGGTMPDDVMTRIWWDVN